MNQRAAQGNRRYRAEMVAVSACFCPACRQRLEMVNIARCPGCGFTGADTAKLFRFSAPQPQTIADHAGLFGAKQIQKIKRSLTQFTEKFPQFDLRVSTVDLDDGVDLRLFAFWLLNAMPLADDEPAERREWSILLVIKSDHSMAIASGYAAEVWISETNWMQLLRDLGERGENGGLDGAIREFSEDLGHKLTEAWHLMEARRRSKRSQTPEML